MLPYGLQFSVFLIVTIIAIKIGFIYSIAAYMAYRFFLKL